MEYVTIGKIVNTFGIRGEVKVDSYTDFEKERFKKDSTVYIGEEHLPLQVAGYRQHKGFLLVCFKDHEDINLIERFKGKMIYKSKEDIKPLKKGEYYFSDLMGLNAMWKASVSEKSCASRKDLPQTICASVKRKMAKNISFHSFRFL